MSSIYKDEKSILERARKCVGLTIEEIYQKSGIEQKKLNLKNKGNIGNLIEKHWFGIENNNSPLPDFQEAGIELKVIPLTQNKDRTISVKERTKVCSIDFKKLFDEKWESSHAKSKLNKILFIYYIYDKEKILNSKVKKIDLYDLGGNDLKIIKNDWLNVKEHVVQGKAHELSETISKILAASRSGSGGINKKTGKERDLVEQPNKDYRTEALKRAFSLKQSFTNQRWNEINKKKYESILELLKTTSENFENAIINKLSELTGKTLGIIANDFNIKVPNSKNAAATIVKKAIGFKSVNSRIKEFEQLGIQVKTIPIREGDLRPWEAVSFQTFKLKELVKEKFYEGEDGEEEWDQCTLKNDLNRILFIPIIRSKKDGIEVEDRVFGKPFFWSPSSEQIKIIEEEWRKYIHEINSGKAKVTRVSHGNDYREVSGLSKESDTKIIHIRPHAKDRTDRDEDNFGNSIVKQSFWLNKSFLQCLLVNNYKKEM